MDVSAIPLPPFALGTASLGDGPRAVAIADAKLLVLDSLAERLELSAPSSTRDVSDDWDRVLPILKDVSTSSEGEWVPLADAVVQAPVEFRQILQAGTNNRRHVIDLAVNYEDIASGRTQEQVRSGTAEMMANRA